MEAIIKSRLTMVGDEVKEFHPLLKELLQKLPNIIDLDYTHGQREMGADFVLSKKHDILGHTEYVGIIAKLGKIHQDFGDVERQIDECFVPRKFLRGKIEININEVWVVATGVITKNAQEKIHHKYRTCKINFIDGIKLQALIDANLPEFWTDINLEVASYLRNLRTRCAEIDRRLSFLQTASKPFYVQQDIYRRERSYYKADLLKAKPAQKIDPHHEIETKELVFIEAPMGYGKSRFLRMMIDHYTSPEIYKETQLLPIDTTYKEIVEEYSNDLEKLIEAKVGSLLKSHAPDATYLLLIDGVDEKNLPLQEQISSLSALINAVHSTPNVKAVFCSRNVRALDQPGVFWSEDHRYELRPLTIDRTIQFLKALCQELNLAERLFEDLKKSQLFKELPRSPIAAILLGNLLAQNSKDLPSNMTDLYSKYIEVALGRWDIEKGLQTQKEYQALDMLMMKIATHMIKHDMNFISIEDVKQMFRDYIDPRNFEITPDELFQKMLARSEVLVIGSNANTLVFKHRTFAEFLFAKSLDRKNGLPIDHHAFELYWVNIYFFYIGLLKDCPEVISALYEYKPTLEEERWGKIATLANYSLAAFATPYNVITESFKTVLIEAAALYQDIVSGRLDSQLTRLPRMLVLFLIQLMIRNNFSYTFFKRALEDVALQIDQEDCDVATKAYALFFLGVTCVELKEPQTFDFLLKGYLEKIPMDIRFALKLEGANLKEKNLLLRKQDKYLKKQIKSKLSFDNIVRDLFGKPIGTTKSPQIAKEKARTAHSKFEVTS